MADALASGASVLRDVGVQVPLRPPTERVYGLSGAKVTNSKEVVTFAFGREEVDGGSLWRRRGLLTADPTFGLSGVSA